MVKAKKKYDWKNGAVLEEHSAQKLKILREYFQKYLHVRCCKPVQERFRLAIVDGFAGGEVYKNNIPGSPLIFIEELERFIEQKNIQRRSENLKKLEIQCDLYLNDKDKDAIDCLRGCIDAHVYHINNKYPELNLNIIYDTKKFEEYYLDIKQCIVKKGFRNILFNLDQFGHAEVKEDTLKDILTTFERPEIFLTFSIQALVTFLNSEKVKSYNNQLKKIDSSIQILDDPTRLITREEELGCVELIIFESFKKFAPYISPFAIHNPNGWKYWLIHFSKSYRAREVYNTTLHENASTTQAHFGRAGLNMLAYNPNDNNSFLYLFDETDSQRSYNQLMNDIPKFIRKSGDTVLVSDFCKKIYNETPASSKTIQTVLIESLDLEVLTPNGGKRRKSNNIEINDIIRINPQKSFSFFYNR